MAARAALWLRRPSRPRSVAVRGTGDGLGAMPRIWGHGLGLGWGPGGSTTCCARKGRLYVCRQRLCRGGTGSRHMSMHCDRKQASLTAPQYELNEQRDAWDPVSFSDASRKGHSIPGPSSRADDQVVFKEERPGGGARCANVGSESLDCIGTERIRGGGTRHPTAGQSTLSAGSG